MYTNFQIALGPICGVRTGHASVDAGAAETPTRFVPQVQALGYLAALWAHERMATRLPPGGGPDETTKILKGVRNERDLLEPL